VEMLAQKQIPENVRRADSLEHILNTRELAPLEQIDLIDTIGKLIYDDFDRCILLGKRTLEIMEKGKINNRQKICETVSGIGMCYVFKNSPDTALHYLNRAMLLAKDLKDKYGEIRMVINIGNTYALQGQYAMALKHYFQALQRCDRLADWADSTNYIRTLGNISEIYYMMGNQSQALYYAKQMVEKPPVLTISNGYLYAQAYYVICCVYLDWGELDRAEENALTAYRVSKQCFNLIYQCFSAEAMARIGILHGDYDKALEYAKESLHCAEQLNDPASYVKAYNVLSSVYLERKQYAESASAACKAMELNSVALDTEPNLAYNIALSEMHLGNREKADTFFRKFNEIMRKNNDKNFRETLMSMEIQYETGKKEMRIATLEKQKTLYVWLGISIAVIILIFLGFLYHLHRINVQKRRLAEQQREIAEQQREIAEQQREIAGQERKLAEQQIRQLEQEKQLVATQAVIEGENAERARISRDMHDGLGSLLSVAKLRLQEIKSYSAMNMNDIVHFGTVMKILEQSIAELRSVVLHLMPESLMRYGLKTAIDDFCNSVPIAHFHYSGTDTRFDNGLEILIYRCVFELVNNALKHASATSINIRLTTDNNLISLSVHDNGAGFDPEKVSYGYGLKNIRNRLAASNGTITINSSPQNGTEINVKVNYEL
jgi:signal transduction histidine kinase